MCGEAVGSATMPHVISHWSYFVSRVVASSVWQFKDFLRRRPILTGAEWLYGPDRGVKDYYPTIAQVTMMWCNLTTGHYVLEEVSMGDAHRKMYFGTQI